MSPTSESCPAWLQKTRAMQAERAAQFGAEPYPPSAALQRAMDQIAARTWTTEALGDRTRLERWNAEARALRTVSERETA